MQATTTSLSSKKSSKKPSKRKISPNRFSNNEDTQFLNPFLLKRNPSSDFNIFHEKTSDSKRSFTKIFTNSNNSDSQGLSTKRKSMSSSKNRLSDALNSLDLATFYEGLIKSQTDFMLPRKYKLLLRKFEKLIKKTYEYQKNNRIGFFENIRYDLQTENIFINMNDLQQIFFIDNNIFQIKKTSKSFILRVKDFPNHDFESFFNEKVESFRDFFVDLIKISHLDFLKSIGEERDYIIYESQKVWHIDFPLEKMSDIPNFDLNSLVSKEKFLTLPSKDKSAFKKRGKIHKSSVHSKLLDTVCFKFFKI